MERFVLTRERNGVQEFLTSGSGVTAAIEQAEFLTKEDIEKRRKGWESVGLLDRWTIMEFQLVKIE